MRRSLLIWLLAVLLPLQAWTASAGLPCGLGEHATPMQAALHGEQAAQDRAHLQAKSSALHEPGHDHHGAVAAAAAADSGAPAGAESAPHDGAHTCSACVTCCPGAAPPGAPVTVAALAVADAVPALPCTGAASAIIGGLERPPRTLVG